MKKSAIVLAFILAGLAAAFLPASAPAASPAPFTAAEPPAGKQAGSAVKISPLDHEFLTVQLSTAPPPLEAGYRAMLENERRFFRRGQANLPALVSAYNQYGMVHVEFTSAKAREDFEKEKAGGVFIISRADRFADLFLDGVETLQALEKHPAVRWIDLGAVSKVPTPAIISYQPAGGGAEAGPGLALSTRPPLPAAPPEDVIRSGDKRIGGLTGKGVVIVIIDTGIDFRNSDFIVGDMPTSRILYYWDTLIYLNPKFTFGAELPPIAAPSGQSLGIVYTQDGLTRDLRTRSRSVPLYDINGHGTSCAGVAAGNGRNAMNNPAAGSLRDAGLGAAAEADLIVVRIAWTEQIQYGFLLGAIVDWVEEKAGTDERLKGKPIVYSCSWGSDSGDRAGNKVLERQIDARFPPTKPGRAICIAAGNDGRSAHHGRVLIEGNQAMLAWEVKSADPQSAREGLALTIYYSGDGDLGDLAVEYVPPATVTGDEREAIKAAVLKDFEAKTYRHGILGTPVTDVRWMLPVGRHELHFLSRRGGRLKPEDAYIMPAGDRAKAEFVGIWRDYGKQIGFPGAAANAITVGSYDWNPSRIDNQGQLVEAAMTVGELSDYSNPGPSRVGAVVKPDIVAPGQYWIVSAPDPRLLIAPRKFRSFNGTSAATPYVAGVVALMMQKKPDLTVGEIKRLLAAYATRDSGKLLPRERRNGWGNGKLDAEAVERILRAVR